MFFFSCALSFFVVVFVAVVVGGGVLFLIPCMYLFPGKVPLWLDYAKYLGQCL